MNGYARCWVGEIVASERFEEVSAVPLLVLFSLAVVAGSAVGILIWRYPRSVPPPTAAAARELGARSRRHERLRALLAPRLDPATATGLALTIALLLAIGGGVVLGALAFLVRTSSELNVIDNGVARWSNRHASSTELRVLNDVTQLGNIFTVIVLSAILVVFETVRERTVWVLAFVSTVLGGEELLMHTVKDLTDRLRPTFNPAAATLGPSFPSGHSATAAAFYAAAALLLGRWRARPARALLGGLAVALAVAVATSRVLLDVHWTTDVVGGLALGWGWFAICAIAFGGRLLRFGVTAEVAGRAATAPVVTERGGNTV